MKTRKKIIWEKDDIVVGEFSFADKQKTKTKKYIEFKRGIVLVVPVEKNSVFLLREFRPLIGKTVWRVPAGHLKHGENPKKGAARELLEETGFVARKLTLIGRYMYMGWMKIPIYIFKAEQFSRQKQHLEFYERINAVKIARARAKKMALQDMIEIHHAFALLKYLES